MDRLAETAEQVSQGELRLPARKIHGNGQGAIRLRAEVSLYQKLRQAVRENAFHLAYQPILDLRTDRIIGAESLLRLQDGPREIPAGEFIETLEQSDLIGVVASDVALYYQEHGLVAILPVELPCKMDAFGLITRTDRLLAPAAQVMLKAIKAVAHDVYGTVLAVDEMA